MCHRRWDFSSVILAFKGMLCKHAMNLPSPHPNQSNHAPAANCTKSIATASMKAQASALARI
jgi:hypothetical protein